MAGGKRCKCSKSINGLAAECLVVTLTLMHVLLSAVELLIHLHIIQDPNADENIQTSGTDKNDTTLSPSSPTQSYDPGGCDNSLPKRLQKTVDIIRYTTLVISAIFCLEIACKILVQKINFFKDFWQVFDILIVLLSLGAEIAFFLEHEKLLCYHEATEAATFVVLLRLWRIPRACDIRKKEYKKKLQDQHHFLRLTKTETEQKYKNLEKVVQNQITEIEKYKTLLHQNNVNFKNEKESTANGNVHFNQGMRSAADQVLHHQENLTKDCHDETDKTDAGVKSVSEKTDSDKPAIDLERNDSDKTSRGNDSGIEEKDSFRSEREVTTDYKARNIEDEVFDSDGSEFPVPAKVQEVEVQIEEISRQKQLPSVTSYSRSSCGEDDDTVLLRRKSSSTGAAAFVNPTFDEDEADAGGTYRSADGIPMTEL